MGMAANKFFLLAPEMFSFPAQNLPFAQLELASIVLSGSLLQIAPVPR